MNMTAQTIDESSSISSISTPVDGSGTKEYITEVTPHDVLLGRGAGPNEHSGNISFRLIVAKQKAKYMATTNRKIKNKIALKTIRTIKAKKGRFLQRVKDTEEEVYELASDKIVLEKTKQALRHLDRNKKSILKEAQEEMKTAASQSSDSVGTTSPVSHQRLLPEALRSAAPFAVQPRLTHADLGLSALQVLALEQDNVRPIFGATTPQLQSISDNLLLARSLGLRSSLPDTTPRSLNTISAGSLPPTAADMLLHQLTTQQNHRHQQQQQQQQNIDMAGALTTALLRQREADVNSRAAELVRAALQRQR